MLVFLTAPPPLSNSFLLINKFSASFARRKNLLGMGMRQARAELKTKLVIPRRPWPCKLRVFQKKNLCITLTRIHRKEHSA